MLDMSAWAFIRGTSLRICGKYRNLVHTCLFLSKYRLCKAITVFLKLIQSEIVSLKFKSKINTLGRWQSKTSLLSTNVDHTSLETAFSIAICRQSGDKWQSTNGNRKHRFDRFLICVRRFLDRFRFPPARCD